jgi:hypothetical protein
MHFGSFEARQLAARAGCAEHGVDRPLPGSSLRPRGLVMALEDEARVSDSNNGRSIVLKA